MQTMPRRRALALVTAGFTGFALAGCGAGAATVLVPPAAPSPITLSEHYSLWDGNYDIQVTLTYQGSSVTNLALEILKHPYPTSVEALLVETLLLDPADRNKATLTNSQPLFKRFIVTAQNTVVRMQGGFWYLVNGVWVPENMAAKLITPQDTVTLTLGDNVPATIF